MKNRVDTEKSIWRREKSPHQLKLVNYFTSSTMFVEDFGVGEEMKKLCSVNFQSSFVLFF